MVNIYSVSHRGRQVNKSTLQGARSLYSYDACLTLLLLLHSSVIDEGHRWDTLIDGVVPGRSVFISLSQQAGDPATPDQCQCTLIIGAHVTSTLVTTQTILATGPSPR